MHKNALNILNKPASIQEFFVKTLVGKAISSVSGETKHCIRKLVDNTKTSELTTATVPKCEEFTYCITTTLKTELINNLTNIDYLICSDGSTDVSVTDKVVFVMFINKNNSAVEFKY
ncbi:hypothetical protein PR048_006424 [Dryococelus australis]|uniref:Uncharacterized protein n=1 Tax=Dryococelus australis TaxID=614101 RepID=A0ABQ9IAX9_9NEOP|nr:hypothetical protein PR048_006424 [Dryococelus australis]